MMIKKSLALGMLLLLLTSLSVAEDLDEKYERNGELFMLVGQGANRGVYDLHNHGSRVPEYLYDPGSAYGIRVDLDRNIYSFVEKSDSGWVNMPGYVPVNDWNPNDSYISVTHHFARGTGGNCWCAPGGYNYNPLRVRGSYAEIPNGKWYHGKNRSGQNRCKKMNALKIDHLFYKYLWSRGMVSPIKSPNKEVAFSRETKKTYYIIRGCHDGCCPDQGQHEEPSKRPITDTLISSFGRAYFYKRTEGQRDGNITVDGSTYQKDIIGDVNDISGQFLGVSAKTANSEWVYLLGDKVIYNWLREANFPVTRSEVKISDVAVSDQWWQKGGIVFAYNSLNGHVYKFERNENAASQAKPVDIPLVGSNPGDVDDIETDGFGNLYFAKTYRDPVKPQDYTDNDIDSISWKYYPDLGSAFGEIFYKQTVSKSAFMLDYYSGSLAPVRVADKTLGENTYHRYVTYTPWTGESLPGDKSGYATIDKAKIIPYGSVLPEVKLPLIDDTIRTEIAAVNVATPPKVVGYIPAHLDIDGPYIRDEEGRPIKLPYTDKFKFEEHQIYIFQAENFPIPDGNGVNLRAEQLKDESASNAVDLISGCKTRTGWTGGFPSTIITSTAKYFWKITMLKDRYGKDRSEVLFGGGGRSIPSPILSVMLDKGTYQIDLAATYDFYDYTKLGYGSLAANKEDVKYSALNDGAFQWAIAPGGGKTAKIIIQVEEAEGSPEIPPGRICIAEPQYDGSGNVLKDKQGNPILAVKYGGTPTSRPAQAGTYSDGSPKYGMPSFNPPVYVIPEDSTWTFTLRDIDYWFARKRDGNGKIVKDKNGDVIKEWVKFGDLNPFSGGYSSKTDRVYQLVQSKPPDPHNPMMTSGTLGWYDQYGNSNNINLSWELRFEAPQFLPLLGQNGGGINEGDTMVDRLYPIQANSADKNDQTAFAVMFGKIDRQYYRDKTAAEEGWKPENRSTQPFSDFDIPSEPYFYHLDCTVVREYSYWAYTEYKWEDAAGNVMSYNVSTPHTLAIQIHAEAKVVVTDQTTPRALTEQEKLCGTTGEPLTSPSGPSALDPLGLPIGYEHPAAIEVTVLDNNPFGSLSGPAESFYTANTFYGKDSQGNVAVPRHDPDNWQGVFAYEVQLKNNDLLKIPLAMEENSKTPARKTKEEALTYYTYLPDLGGESVILESVKLLSGDDEKKQPKTAESWAVYTINLSDLNDFSDPNESYNQGKGNVLPLGRQGFPAYSYSIELTDASGNVNEIPLGVIDVRDNDKPNIFVEVESIRQHNKQLVPTNILDSFTQQFSFVDNSPVWGDPVTNWMINPVPRDAGRSMFESMKVTNGTGIDKPVKAEAVSDLFKVFEDTRILFKYSVVDNITRAQTNEAKAVISSENITLGVAKEGHVEWKLLGMEEEPVSINPETTEFVHVFHEHELAGYTHPEMGPLNDYVLVIESSDFATDWEGNPLTNEAVPDCTNTRKLRVRVPVFDTRVRVHTLQTKASHGVLQTGQASSGDSEDESDSEDSESEVESGDSGEESEE